jgi:hypothetical protein
MFDFVLLTIEKITLPRSISTNDHIVFFIEWLHHSLFTITFEALYDYLRETKNKTKCEKKASKTKCKSA